MKKTLEAIGYPLCTVKGLVAERLGEIILVPEIAKISDDSKTQLKGKWFPAPVGFRFRELLGFPEVQWLGVCDDKSGKLGIATIKKGELSLNWYDFEDTFSKCERLWLVSSLGTGFSSRILEIYRSTFELKQAELFSDDQKYTFHVIDNRCIKMISDDGRNVITLVYSEQLGMGVSDVTNDERRPYHNLSRYVRGGDVFSYLSQMTREMDSLADVDRAMKDYHQSAAD
jgi:hypothetical protein